MIVRYVFDTGALIAAERGQQRALRFLDLVRLGRAVIAVPMPVILEWWRGRNDVRERILRAVSIEPLSLPIAKAAGEALAELRSVDARRSIDAAVMATAALRGGTVLTQDVEDLELLGVHFPSVRVLGV
ncbi:MAG: PIN domain-containing protein [Labilithrix sp.]|nr:PIN domain-containing protein [Labilithrix sp.]